MSNYRSDSQSKAGAYIVMLILAIIFYAWFYSASANGEGVVQSKWTETNTSCSDGDCTTTTSYLVQFDDGRVYDVFWGTRDWDRMVVGSKIRFNARGRDIRFFGWRIMQPSIFGFETIQGPPQ